MKLKNKIKKYEAMFELKKRNDDSIIVFKDNASDNLKDSVFKAHADRLPDDWIFDIYHSILSTLMDYDIETIDDIEEFRSEIVDGLVSVYTYDLTKWLNTSNYNVYYITEALEDYGPFDDGFKLLAMAQYIAIDEIFNEVINLLS